MSSILKSRKLSDDSPAHQDSGTYSFPERAAIRPDEVPMSVTGPIPELTSLVFFMEEALRSCDKFGTPALKSDAEKWLSAARQALKDSEFENSQLP